MNPHVARALESALEWARTHRADYAKQLEGLTERKTEVETALAEIDERIASLEAALAEKVTA